MIQVFFFGVKSPSEKGHFLYAEGMLAVYGSPPLPFKFQILDGSFLQQPETQGRLHLAIINGWTILGMWDRTGDPRMGSNASFVAQGVHTIEEMKVIAQDAFPAIWNRIHNLNK